jgi:hypothetical protein
MDDDPFDKIRAEMDQVRADHRRAMDEALAQVQAAISLAQAEMREARIDFQTRMMIARRQVEKIRRSITQSRRKPPGHEEGGELEPVAPKPNPKPLAGGAEAPIE